MIKDINTSNKARTKLETQLTDTASELEKTQKILKKERTKLSKLSFTPPEFESKGTTTGTMEVPSGRVVYKKAYDIFNIPVSLKDNFDFEMPTWEWYKLDKEGNEVAADHPYVPMKDDKYIFRPKQLVMVLWALATNQKAWLSGHTGTGKSTLVKEVAARLNWPLIRVNFDSEITRLDLIGRDVLSQEDGATTSTFIDGILPQAMQGPNILLCDEMDFVRPDVAYVMQRALENEGLLVTEDGGRIIEPHEMFRIIATANTAGQGDEWGQYQGARNQSMAFLDRFTVWIEVDYLKEKEEKALLKMKVDNISEDQATTIIKYVREHRSAFTGSEIVQPLSPRGVTALGKAVVTFSPLYKDEKEGLRVALEATILNRANVQDKSVISGLIDRVFNVK
jgi:cobaltochelatase CobS